MEYIRISDSKLKVMLSADDMRNYAIDERNGSGTKEAFRSLMQDAKTRCGFNGLDGRVFVQLYRSKAGGCELFVTKLSGEHREYEEDSEEWEDGMYTEYQRLCEERYGERLSERGTKRRRVIYSFDSMNNLIDACHGILSSTYKGASMAYADRGKRCFYLALEEENFLVGEHLGRLCPSSFNYYINEHCDLFCGEAVPILGKLA